jgi:hypothetical protein
VKEYGKLTPEQFKGFIDFLPEVRKQGEDLRSAVRSVSKERLDELLVAGYSWAALYELPFHEHAAVVVVGLGLGGYVRDLAQSPDPQQRLLDDLPREDIIDESAIEADPQSTIGMVFSLQRTLLCVMLYQRSMSSLVQEVRETGSHDALFKAVRVDRAVLAAPSIADRIARAELSGDETFFRHLRSALRGPQKKIWEAYKDLRYALLVLRELGLGSLSDAQLERLMVDTLGVYPNTPSARKNLRAQYQQSRRIKTI